MQSTVNTTPQNNESAISQVEPCWHVLGAGAMGCLWAARLWQWERAHGAREVRLLLRNADAVSHYKSSAGLLLEDSDRQYHCPVPATSTEQLHAPISLLLVTTKAQDLEAAMLSVANNITDETRIVLLQNGFQNQRKISAQYGAERVFCLSNSHGAYLRSPFEVVHAGHGEAWLGQLTKSIDASHQLLTLLPATMMNIQVDTDIEQRLWLKLAINCAVNALTVAHDCCNGDLLTHPVAREQLINLCDEIEQIYAAVPDAPMLKNLLYSVDKVLLDTARNFSSMLQDVRNGKQTEISELNGYLCKLAQKAGAPCELNAALLRQIS